MILLQAIKGVFFLTILSVWLAACGGGGSSSNKPCGSVVDIGPNSKVDGVLQDGDCRVDDIFPGEDDSSFVDEYRITLTTGGTLIITMRSTELDSFLALLNTSASCAEGCDPAVIIATDDDSGGGVSGTDALISMDLAAGTYGIGANSVFPNSGSYTLETLFGSLWNLNDITITNFSPTIGGFDIENLFDGSSGHAESDMTIFEDGRAAGTAHFVEWQTPAPVTINNYRLFANGDGAPSFDRSITKFTLKAKNPAGAFEVISALVTTNPYDLTPCNVGGSFLEVSINLPTPTTAQEFRAEFVQFATSSVSSGPRIRELNGFADPDPTGCVLP
jgi:hypothetical protein